MIRIESTCVIVYRPNLVSRAPLIYSEYSLTKFVFIFFVERKWVSIDSPCFLIVFFQLQICWRKSSFNAWKQMAMEKGKDNQFPLRVNSVRQIEKHKSEKHIDTEGQFHQRSTCSFYASSLTPVEYKAKM